MSRKGGKDPCRPVASWINLGDENLRYPHPFMGVTWASLPLVRWGQVFPCWCSHLNPHWWVLWQSREPLEFISRTPLSLPPKAMEVRTKKKSKWFIGKRKGVLYAVMKCWVTSQLFFKEYSKNQKSTVWVFFFFFLRGSTVWVYIRLFKFLNLTLRVNFRIKLWSGLNLDPSL